MLDDPPGIKLTYYGEKEERVLFELPARPVATTSEVCSALENLLGMNVVEVDLSQLREYSSADPSNADQEPYDWDLISSHLVALLPKENLQRVLLNSDVSHILRGKCQGRLLELLKTSIGDQIEMVNILDKSYKLKHFLTVDYLAHKLVDKKSMSTSLSTTISVLNNLGEHQNIPTGFVRSVVSAYTHLKKNKRVGKRRYNKLHRVVVRNRNTPRNTITKPSTSTGGGTENVSQILREPAAKGVKDCSTSSSFLVEATNEPMSPEFGFPAKRMKNDNPEPPEFEETSFRAFKCYICKLRYTAPKRKNVKQQFGAALKQYPRLCLKCAQFNWTKRRQSAQLDGKYALVTGGRIKIGYELVLKLLRDGARVIVTTRFPHDAAKRYAQEADYDNWSYRLKIYPLDLKDLTGVFKFIKYVQNMVPHLDILINNAAQTIRRPIHFYRHLLDYEYIPRSHLEQTEQDILAVDEKLNYGIAKYTLASLNVPPATDSLTEMSDDDDDDTSDETVITCGFAAAEVSFPVDDEDQPVDIEDSPEDELQSIHLGQVEESASQEGYVAATSDSKDGISDTCYLARDKLQPQEDATNRSDPHELVPVPLNDPWNSSVMDKYFPPGVLDTDGQQLDLRPVNSWRAVLDNVPLGEFLEVFVINTVAPFILNKELKPLLVKSPSLRRFIVNVSAMEGQFSRNAKTQFHPHTNMAKAALNMMTRTAALSYKEDNIFMTSVDTGWVTDERPFHMAQHEQRKKGFVLPLDSIDGASRVYDPVVTGLDETKEPYYAVFLKDYCPYPW